MPHPDGSATDGPEACATCRKVSDSLHECDDIEYADRKPRPKFCSECMIGKKVKVFWPVDNSWYSGTVKSFNVQSGEHLLEYEDGDTEWVRIAEIAAAHQNLHPDAGYTADPGRPSISPVNTLSSGELRSPDESTVSDSKDTNTDKSATVQPDPAISNSNSPPKISSASDRPSWSGSQARPKPSNSGAADTTAPRANTTAPLPGVPVPHGYPYGGPPGAAIPGAYPYGYGAPPPPTGAYPYPPHSSYGSPPGYPSPFNSIPPSTSSSSNKPGTSEGASSSRSDPTNSPEQSSKERDKDSKNKKTGPRVWTRAEDSFLLNMVQTMKMPIKWSVVAQSLTDRSGKQCRERYVNHLNPRLKVADWNPVEDATIFQLYSSTGSHWAKMSKMIPGRTDNGIKNRFHNLRRQLEREDEHRLRLSKVQDFPQEVRLDRLRVFPDHLQGKADILWDISSGIGILAAQTVLGGGIARNAGRFGPYKRPTAKPEPCSRCGLYVPSVQTGREICTRTGWCVSCTRIPPHISGNLLRECLNLRREENVELRKMIESWDRVAGDADAKKNGNPNGAPSS